MIILRFLTFCLFLFSFSLNTAFALEKVRVGVLEFGTVSWEMDTVQQHKLAEKAGVELEVVPLASADASTVALQGGAVDVIVSDWVWVNRQRAAGQDYTLFPYSYSLVGMVICITCLITSRLNAGCIGFITVCFRAPIRKFCWNNELRYFPDVFPFYCTVPTVETARIGGNPCA